jgi:hypothetical protein
LEQTVGILLDHDTYRRVPTKRTGYEDIALYNKASKEIGLNPYYMSLRHITKKTALGFIFDGHRYRLVRRRIPKVIHNRAITLSPPSIQKLKTLAQSSIVFNQKNRLGKHHIYSLLSENRTLREYLPSTMLYSKENMKKAMKEYSAIFIKPTSGSIGEGVIKLKKHETGQWNMYWKKGEPTRMSRQKMLATIEQKVGNRSYLVQEEIPLATYKGRPYDVRVSVQRGEKGQWEVTGMVGKVAAAGRHVTNVAKGGKVMRCEELFQASGFYVETMKNSIGLISLEMAKYLGKRLPHLADIGLDMGVDYKGNIRLIEMNGRDQRIAFKKARMDTTFFQTYATPLKYAKYLLKTK